ncbi:MAG TPA: trypsin-like peptidase domain-containing protein, partial [Solirubrobacteraceae bacterium]|nr:trypsin-like peptidase domain-containing protein [Solirubrobacteraceae bacterium]
VPKPNRAILGSAGARRARPSVVRVLGTACGLGVEGSGWVAAPQVVVTNAHVVAGETDTTVQVGGNPPSLAAQVVDFDPHDDVAILRVPGLRERPLTLAAQPSSGTGVAILGYPLDGPFDAEPGRIGQTQAVSTENAYGNGPVTRSITPLRGLVRPGNSGGPLVSSSGQVDGTVFAAITGGSPTSGPGGMAVPNSVVAAQLAIGKSRTSPVGSGPCAG